MDQSKAAELQTYQTGSAPGYQPATTYQPAGTYQPATTYQPVDSAPAYQPNPSVAYPGQPQPQQYVAAPNGTTYQYYPQQQQPQVAYVSQGQPQVSYIQQQPGVQYQTAAGQQVVVVTAPGGPGYVTGPPLPAGTVFMMRIKTAYGIFRLIQTLLSIVVMGIVCGLISYDSDYWFYWLGLLVLPLASVITGFMQLFSHGARSWAYGGGADIAYGILYLLYGVALAVVYLVIYPVLFLSGTGIYIPIGYFNTINASIAMSELLAIAYFFTGCSLACCKCLPSPRF